MFSTQLSYKSAAEINSSMLRVYNHMALAVVVSMFVSWYVGTTPSLVEFFFTGFTKWVVIFAPLVFIFLTPVLFNAGIGRLGAQLVLHGFAALMGLSFALIFAIYNMGSIVSAFMGAAILFGVLSFYGYFTKRNLDGIGSFMFVGLIAIIIASVVNIFLGSSLFAMVISALAIIIFLGLTAYDTQRLREILSVSGDNYVAEVQGALTLYLNFINIFLSLLQLFGEKKD